jgi:hypothetical protein
MSMPWQSGVDIMWNAWSSQSKLAVADMGTLHQSPVLCTAHPAYIHAQPFPSDVHNRGLNICAANIGSHPFMTAVGFEGLAAKQWVLPYTRVRLLQGKLKRREAVSLAKRKNAAEIIVARSAIHAFVLALCCIPGHIRSKPNTMLGVRHELPAWWFVHAAAPLSGTRPAALSFSDLQKVNPSVAFSLECRELGLF